jgi:hypothetical protein
LIIRQADYRLEKRTKTDLTVQEVMMNNYSSSSNFTTVFFLVSLFIGMGVLIYHTCEISTENRQLRETAAALQASLSEAKAKIAELEGKIAKLEEDNTASEANIQTLENEIEGLNVELAQAYARIDEMNKAETARTTDTAVVCDEKGDGKPENSGSAIVQNGSPEVLQSSIIPTDPDFWLKIGVVLLVGLNLFFVLLVAYALLKRVLWKRAALMNAMYNNQRLPQNSNYTYIVDTRFTNR